MMKIGVIINYYDTLAPIDREVFYKKCQVPDNMEICVVNNNSDNLTAQVLQDIGIDVPRINVINLNQRKSDHAMIKAATRFMTSNFNLSVLGIITNTEGISLVKILEAIAEKGHMLFNHVDNAFGTSQIKASRSNEYVSIKMSELFSKPSNFEV